MLAEPRARVTRILRRTLLHFSARAAEPTSGGAQQELPLVTNSDGSRAHVAMAPTAVPDAILLVDDDEFMLDMLPQRLRRIFPERTRILSARTPDDALRLARENADAHLVILSDYDLRAAKTGVDVLREAERIAPTSTRILFSGHTAAEIGPTDDRIVHGFLEKPYRLDDLLPPFLDLLRARAP